MPWSLCSKVCGTTGNPFLNEVTMSLFALVWSDLCAYVWKPYSPKQLKFWLFLCRQSLFHRALFYVPFYRYGHWAFRQCRIPIWKHLHQVLYLLLLPGMRLLTSVDLNHKATIGPGLILLHGNQVIGEIEAGRNLTVHDGVLLGHADDGACPVLGEDVLLGARCIIVGGIRVGDRVKVGAGTTVVKSLPAGAVAVGAAIRIFSPSASVSSEASSD